MAFIIHIILLIVCAVFIVVTVHFMFCRQPKFIKVRRKERMDQLKERKKKHVKKEEEMSEEDEEEEEEEEDEEQKQEDSAE